MPKPKKKAVPEDYTLTINELKAVYELAKRFGDLGKLRQALLEAEKFTTESDRAAREGQNRLGRLPER